MYTLRFVRFVASSTNILSISSTSFATLERFIISCYCYYKILRLYCYAQLMQLLILDSGVSSSTTSKSAVDQ